MPRAANFTLRPATVADGEMILWLEEAAVKDYAVALWGTWRPSAMLGNLDIRNHEIVMRNEAPIGSIATRLENDAFHITRLYLHPDHRNQGIGAEVLDVLVARAQRLPVRLRVLVTNPASAFYLREGFAIERETPEHRYLVKPPRGEDS